MDKNIKLLIADDQSLIRDGIASLLSLQEDITVAGTARNGEEAVRKARDLKPDVILMDIRMPVMDGIAAADEIIKKGYCSRIIMLTTFDDDEYIIKSLKAGAVGYLLKDIPEAELAQAVKLAYQGIFQLADSAAGKLVGNINGSMEKSKTGLTEEDNELLQIINTLPERERDVLSEIARGLTNREIADTLFLSEGTVKNYVSNILAALDLRDRTQAALLAYRLGLAEGEKNRLFRSSI